MAVPLSSLHLNRIFVHLNSAKIIGFVFLLLALPYLLTLDAEAQNITPAQPPIEVVEHFHDVLLTTMKEAEQLGVVGRFQKLESVLPESFHLAVMIQVASGSAWRTASETERAELVTAFTRLTIATYAAQFDGYSGQSFKVLGTKPGPQKTTLVQTQLVNPGGTDVDLVYVTRLIKGQWRIIDVLLDTGISELARKRSEYRLILKSGGVTGLIGALKDKTQALMAG